LSKLRTTSHYLLVIGRDLNQESTLKQARDTRWGSNYEQFEFNWFVLSSY